MKLYLLCLILILLLNGCICADNGEKKVQPNPTSEYTSMELTTTTEAPSELEVYKGEIYHVFYHYLIAYPEIAKKTSYGADLFKDCITPIEFRRSLEELYTNDFVLVDINSYLSYDETGNAKLEPIIVPKGKKPLVMSFDDINYYSKNLGKGTCDKIILDDKGNFAMLTIKNDKKELITYDNCVVPMLEQFCKEYPDFSPFGVKGVLALTGFDGILGYRVQRDSPDREEEIKAVTPIVEALKDSGWTFASHSFGHIHFKTAGLKRVKSDTKNWKNEVASIVGDTQVYVFPFGEYTDHSSEEFQYLLDSGFQIFCGVGMRPYIKAYNNYLFMDRQSIDGYSLVNHTKYLEPLMDNKKVIDTKER